MYPWKYIRLIGMMVVGFFVVSMYLKRQPRVPLGPGEPLEPVR